MTKHVLPNDPPHLKAAFRDLGLSEIQGPKHSKRILEMLRLAGFPNVQNDEDAWCAVAVGAWLVEAGLKSSGSRMARSYAKYGRACDVTKPIPRGAIAVWPRGAPPSGHVNIVLHDDGAFLTCIGGNQSNGQGGGVTITRERRTNLVAARMPIYPKAKPVPPPPDIEPIDEPTVVVPVDAPPAVQEKQIQDSAERDAEPRSSWLVRKWKGLTGWLSGVIGVGGLGALTDPWVIVAIGGVFVAVIILFVLFMGPGNVRAWIRKQVT